MKSTGIVRKVDELGRVVIPKETRELLSIAVGDSLEIFKDENTVILRKYAPGCTFCGNMKSITQYKGVFICEECMENLKSNT
ncbi:MULTISPECIES: AbrB/MazE/SpoVT family DNA-binding domain-containing protein [Clostridium]|jgi:transcriptional pleiotropic regulator of transition state genes|uniref:Transcriptional regulator, AbrB family n=1 Tax=Clostridium saccharoperbutylacetonicum N1-4(HMT) TaxID=931276 RepID=M1MFQ8_9CLOT|nr:MULTISPECIES: AbrB/MazE/SpoVT family DNA-binding domain-containing protein [Clostridium]AGF56739.1 transcriptional regulator, AbrB family [Clostridium saccharoperbutylacetonicum N1-4(HMT)]AQR95398.1 transition state regulatory protein AbrB [Clostridium saccharoperbutylacetonicum]NRT62506.1 transcriptional pleiotropic regulator of transition state genes [Clostridium saccharoperbutylacetonicum]NSB25853.1 transcriptional pleiotropic regulator of transition state genes [Clostridium saccharoperbu